MLPLISALVIHKMLNMSFLSNLSTTIQYIDSFWAVILYIGFLRKISKTQKVVAFDPLPRYHIRRPFSLYLLIPYRHSDISKT